MADNLREMDLLVTPSRWYENCPLVLFNSLTIHTPVLVSDVAGMAEFLKPGLNEDSFERGNADDLKLKLRNLARSRTKIDSLSKTTSYERSSSIMAAERLKIYAL